MMAERERKMMRIKIMKKKDEVKFGTGKNTSNQGRKNIVDREKSVRKRGIYTCTQKTGRNRRKETR